MNGHMFAETEWHKLSVRPDVAPVRHGETPKNLFATETPAPSV